MVYFWCNNCDAAAIPTEAGTCNDCDSPLDNYFKLTCSKESCGAQFVSHRSFKRPVCTKCRTSVCTVCNKEFVKLRDFHKSGVCKPCFHKSSSVEAAPVEADPVEADPVEADPVEADPVEADPVEADPVEADPPRHQPAPSQQRPALPQHRPAPPQHRPAPPQQRPVPTQHTDSQYSQHTSSSSMMVPLGRLPGTNLYIYAHAPVPVPVLSQTHETRQWPLSAYQKSDMRAARYVKV
jgi:hypothetical protein